MVLPIAPMLPLKISTFKLLLQACSHYLLPSYTTWHVYLRKHELCHCIKDVEQAVLDPATCTSVAFGCARHDMG